MFSINYPETPLLRVSMARGGPRLQFSDAHLLFLSYYAPVFFLSQFYWLSPFRNQTIIQDWCIPEYNFIAFIPPSEKYYPLNIENYKEIPKR
jgi:hypothetical protein